MKMLTIKQMIASLVAVLSVCLFIGLLYSQPFADFANADESTAFYIYTTSAGAGHEFQESRPSREEMAPLLELLEAGSLRLAGRSRYIQWESEDALYRLFFCHEENGAWVQRMRILTFAPTGWCTFITTGWDISAIGSQAVTWTPWSRHCWRCRA